MLPWDHIKSGVTKAYLKRERKRAFEEKNTPDCREKCLDCGVCDHENIAPVLFTHGPSSSEVEKTLSNHRPLMPKKYRMTFTKTDNAKYLSHLELIRLIVRALKRAGLKLFYSKGYHPMPKISFASALPVGTESIDETVDIELLEPVPISLAKEKINQQLPEGIKAHCLDDITGENKSLRLRESHYHITMNGFQIERSDLEKFLQSVYFPITKRGKKGEQILNARSMVKSMNLISPNALNLVITHTVGPSLKPIEIVKGVFNLDNQHAQGIKILKTKQIMS